MKHTKIAAHLITVLLCIYLVGCASRMIDVRAGSGNVNLQNAGSVSACKPLGKVSVSVMAEFGLYTRSADDVEANLLQMARNSAVDSGADTVVKEEMTAYGHRTFGLYKCQR